MEYLYSLAPKFVVIVNFRGRKVYEPPRFMNASEASQQILDIIARRRNTDEDQKGKKIIHTSSL